MQIKPDEIASILRQRIEGIDPGSADLTEVGTVLSVADGIARIHGLDNCMALEMLDLPHGVTGLALNLEADNVGAVLSARELAERLDPRSLEEELSVRLDEELPLMVAAVSEELSPGMWEQMADPARDVVIAQVRQSVLSTATETFDELRSVSDELLDLHALVVDLLSGENTTRLVELFRRMGRRELRFIILYGGVFGLLVGLVQVLLFGILGNWWLMPVIGIVVGLGTNWLALQMIFRPMEPRRFGFITYQGMFPKRQREIAAEYGEVAAEEIFTPANLFRLLSEGETGTRIASVVLHKVDEAVQRHRGTLELLTSIEITDEMIWRTQTILIRLLGERMPEVRTEVEQVVAERLDVAKLVETRLGDMDKADFERLLRGIFEEDEWILVVIGGVLGGLVGLLQAAVVLAL